MKKLSQVIAEAQTVLDIQDDAIGYISTGELQKYLTITDKFISDDTKFLINYIISNPDKFKGTKPLEDLFYGPIPKDENLKKCYSIIRKLNTQERLLEIPQFQSKEQFDGIISMQINPDEILLDLKSEKGRNEVAKKYDKLVWKIARTFIGKSSLTLDELHSAGLGGLVYAMNNYGKKTDYSKTDDETRKSKTFFSYASWIIRNGILEAIKNESHIVHISVSQQTKERKETGRNTKSFTISGDESITGDSESGKSRFDTIAGDQFGGDGSRTLDYQDLEHDWEILYKLLDKTFSKPKDKEALEAFYQFHELNGREKMDMQTLEKKLGRRLSYPFYKITNYLLNDPKASVIFKEIRELMAECRNYADQLDNWGEIIQTNTQISTISE